MGVTSLEYIEAYEGQIYEYADESRRSRNRVQTPSERYKAVRDAQRDSGVRIRIARAVLNQKDFLPELGKWAPFVTDGAQRKSMGNLAMTVFDTAQQPIACGDAHTQESLEDLLQRRYPKLFLPTGPIEVAGIEEFGNIDSGLFIGLTFVPGFVHDERLLVRPIVAPELSLGDAHQKDHRLHVSLGRLARGSNSTEIKRVLAPVIPKYVQFQPATVTVEHLHAQKTG